MRAGTHLCALYSDPAERERARCAFLREGQQRGDRCLSLVDHLDGALALEHSGVEDPGDIHRPGVHRASDVCLRAGQLSVDRMTSFLTDSARRATETGFPHLRVTIEMGWLLRQPRAVDDLLLYESAAHQVVEQLSAVVMCVYDLPSLGVEMLVAAIRTHEMVRLDGTVLVSSHDQTGAGHGAADVQAHRERAAAGDGWDALTVSELRIVAHVADGKTNRAIATLLVFSRHTVDAHLNHIYIKIGHPHPR